jgi:hypothetical protein
LGNKITTGLQNQLEAQAISKTEGLINDKSNEFFNQFGSGRTEKVDSSGNVVESMVAGVSSLLVAKLGIITTLPLIYPTMTTATAYCTTGKLL